MYSKVTNCFHLVILLSAKKHVRQKIHVGLCESYTSLITASDFIHVTTQTAASYRPTIAIRIRKSGLVDGGAGDRTGDLPSREPQIPLRIKNTQIQQQTEKRSTNLGEVYPLLLV